MTTKRKLRLSHNSVLFLSGLAGMAYTTIQDGTERPTLILAFLGMMGVAGPLRLDEALRGKKEQQDDKPGGGS